MPVVLTTPVGKLKSDILDFAFDDCGVFGFGFERTAEEQSTALRKLNAMMLEEPWSKLGYRQPTRGAGLPEEASGIPDFAFNAVAQYLALRIAPGMGQTLAPEQRATLARSLATLEAQLATIPTAQLPGNTVLGSGWRMNGYYNRARWPYSGRVSDAG